MAGRFEPPGHEHVGGESLKRGVGSRPPSARALTVCDCGHTERERELIDKYNEACDLLLEKLKAHKADAAPLTTNSAIVRRCSREVRNELDYGMSGMQVEMVLAALKT